MVGAVECQRNANEMKQAAIVLVGHDGFGDLADCEAFDCLVQLANEPCHLFGRVFLKGMMQGILANNLNLGTRRLSS